ncbi:hypothetical protein SDC9_160280 [bioreactor metagenome]|uniref:Uncharacterized protein n=1 Tax=bioreactor metagenome TaxID=1076179 RepID=A0A645FG80_9ZZZZ
MITSAAVCHQVSVQNNLHPKSPMLMSNNHYEPKLTDKGLRLYHDEGRTRISLPFATTQVQGAISTKEREPIRKYAK